MTPPSKRINLGAMNGAENDQPTLRGRSLVLTRPAGENRAFADRLRRRGAQVVTLAPFRVVSRNDPAILAIALRAAANADVLVFASTLAVRHVFALLPDWLPRGGVIAQGPATAQALAAHGIAAEMPKSGFRSEEVLLHPWLARPRRVVRLTGAGGRDWLVQRLRERGIDAADLAVYERSPCAARPDSLRRIDAMAQPQLIVSSRDALLALPALLGSERWLRLAGETLYVSSDRLAALARGMHCRDVVVADSARSVDLVAAIERTR
ncbi:MAG: uroporphyrinogen-III synthase [Rhodanobacteraceae bacterium]|nr:uroporphyrinogen-III synthase [Rhodanobacteraceae bacterium]